MCTLVAPFSHYYWYYTPCSKFDELLVIWVGWIFLVSQVETARLPITQNIYTPYHIPKSPPLITLHFILSTSRLFLVAVIHGSSVCFLCKNKRLLILGASFTRRNDNICQSLPDWIHKSKKRWMGSTGVAFWVWRGVFEDRWDNGCARHFCVNTSDHIFTSIISVFVWNIHPFDFYMHNLHPYDDNNTSFHKRNHNNSVKLNICDLPLTGKAFSSDIFVFMQRTSIGSKYDLAINLK